jgi:lipoate-protein ligase A
LNQDIAVGQMIDLIQEAFEEKFKIELKEDTPDPWEASTISRYAEERYKNGEWIFSHKHPRARMGIGQLKTKGGLVEIYLSLSGASIENVLITGDFFSSTEDLHRLENALKWTSTRKESIEEKISSVWREDMIYGLDVPSLTRAILLAKENQVRL